MCQGKLLYTGIVYSVDSNNLFISIYVETLVIISTKILFIYRRNLKSGKFIRYNFIDGLFQYVETRFLEKK